MCKHAARYTHSTLHNFCIWYDFVKQLNKTNKEIRLFQFAFRHSDRQSGVNHRQGSNLVVCYCSNYGKWLANFVCNIRKITKQFMCLPLLKIVVPDTLFVFAAYCWSQQFIHFVTLKNRWSSDSQVIYKLTPWYSYVDIVGHSCQPNSS